MEKDISCDTVFPDDNIYETQCAVIYALVYISHFLITLILLFINYTSIKSNSIFFIPTQKKLHTCTFISSYFIIITENIKANIKLISIKGVLL